MLNLNSAHQASSKLTKRNPSPVTESDLLAFVEIDSDFGFEMQALGHLQAAGFSCLHGGTYKDPVTGKARQFDIRAYIDHGNTTLALAVECKNLSTTNPLMLSAVPRTGSEAFHDVLQFHAEPPRYCHVQRFSGDQSVYKPGLMVGKKSHHVKRDSSSGQLVSDDALTFEKLNQAINSSHDLLLELATKSSPPFARVIVPVLVIPNGLLWQVDYRQDGTIMTQPRQIDRSTLFLNHIWSVSESPLSEIKYSLTHLEIVVLKSLKDFAEAWFS